MQDSVQPGDAITVTGFPARNGSRQVWSNRMTMTQGGKQVLNVQAAMAPPPLVEAADAGRSERCAAAGDGAWRR